MPLYEYECSACGQRVELLQRTDDPGPAACEACGGPMRRLLSAPAFQFKGTGWYVTDYAGRKGPAEGATTSDAGEKAEASGAASASEKPAPVKAEGSSKAAESGD